MKKFFYIGMVVILLMALSLVGYGAYLNKRGENIIAERTENRKLPVIGAVAEVRSLKPIIELDTANLYSEEMTDAVAMLDGQITAAFVEKNSHVNAGQVMFTINNPQIPLKIEQASANISRAEASLAQATNSYHRYERLMAKNATSKEKYDESEAQFNAAKASLAASVAEKEQLEIQYSYRNVTAPIDGDVLILYRQPGSYVQVGTPLALIGKFQSLLFAANFDDKIIKRLIKGADVKLSFRDNKIQKAYDTGFAAGNLGRAQQFTAKLREIVPNIDEPAAIRRVVWEIDNSERLLEPQTYSGLTIVGTAPYECLTVPLSSMVDSARNEVYLYAPDGTLKRQAVVTGADDGTYIEVVSGLNPGDVVITSKARGFEDGLPVELTLEKS